MESQGAWTPWLFLALFLMASFLMIWRLEAMSAGGFEGTVLGTLVMPYCSGMGNLIFAFILGQTGGNGADVMTNSLVNNVTNMTLVLGLPAIIWGINVLMLPLCWWVYFYSGRCFTYLKCSKRMCVRANRVSISCCR